MSARSGKSAGKGNANDIKQTNRATISPEDAGSGELPPTRETRAARTQYESAKAVVRRQHEREIERLRIELKEDAKASDNLLFNSRSGQCRCQLFHEPRLPSLFYSILARAPATATEFTVTFCLG